MLNVQEISRQEISPLENTDDVSAYEKHDFGTTTTWGMNNWKVICESYTNTFGGGCYSSSKLCVEYGGDEKTFLFGGVFRDGHSEDRDRPDLRICGFKILAMSKKALILEILTEYSPKLFRLTIVRPRKYHDVDHTTDYVGMFER